MEVLPQQRRALRRELCNAGVFAMRFARCDGAVDPRDTAVQHRDFFGVIGRMLGAMLVAFEPARVHA